MEILISEKLKSCLKQHREIGKNKMIEIAKDTIGIIGDFFYDFYVPDSWQLKDIKRVDENTMIFYWKTESGESTCPECDTLSYCGCNTYKKRTIQDLPMAGMTVYHEVTSMRFYCNNQECEHKTFVEQFYEITGSYGRFTYRLQDHIIRQAIESNCNATTKTLKKSGVRIGKDAVIRMVKKKGAFVMEQNLNRDDVKVLSMDDINLRKGNSSTACSVFIDGKTHRVLTIVQGATKEVAEKVIKKYPSADIVSRDRGNAYCAAAKKCGKKTQVADGFHLVQNIHKAVKDALSMEMAHDLFIREGDGWIKMIDSENEKSETNNSSNHDDDDCLVEPTTLESNDIEKRIHLAGINTRQAEKYRRTIKVLELTQRRLRTPEIAKRLSIKIADVIRYRKDATQTIKKVERKIDEYFKMKKKGKWEYHQKTIAKNARPSSESIVEPYKDTVLRMLKEGKNHRNIHPVIVKEGFKGCANSVYQYIIKYCHENNIPYGRNSRVIPTKERTTDSTASRPENISLKRTSRQTLYGCILNEASERKKEIKKALLALEESPNNSKNMDNQSEPGEWVNKSSYPDSVARIIFDTKPKKKNPRKKLSDKEFEHIKSKFGYIQHLTDFLVSFHDIFLSLDVAKLDSFIRNYKDDANESISTFASGLEKDYDAVKNSIIYPEISNGPIEGFNNKIKLIKRRSFGRAGIELLNAYALLPWYYKDLDENCNSAA